MNFNKNIWDETEAKEFGEFETLELGGHEIVIMDAREYTSPTTGNASLKISVDIAGKDKQAGFFKKQYDDNIAVDKKWPVGAIRYLSLKDEQLAFLKGFISAVENSNSGFKFNIDGNWDQLKGKKIVGVFGWEEYKDNDGNIKVATKLVQFRSLDKLKEIQIPKVKLIDGQFIDYEKYHKFKTNNTMTSSGNYVEISGDMLPF